METVLSIRNNELILTFSRMSLTSLCFYIILIKYIDYISIGICKFESLSSNKTLFL